MMATSKNPAADKYATTIAEIQEHFGVSIECAKYVFHRAVRNRKKDDKYLLWTVQLQNALIIADKCLGINWDSLVFGQEEDKLALQGIHIKDMSNSVFQWSISDTNDNEWTTVAKKRKKKRFTLNVGIYI